MMAATIARKIVLPNLTPTSSEISRLLASDLPEYHLVFCRDCLVHFSYQDVRKALKNLIRSESKYLLTTSFPGRKNYDIVTGNWRALDLEAPPFDFPKPLLIINEGCTERNGRYADKSMVLWDLSQLSRIEFLNE